MVVVSAQVEAELVELPLEDRKEFLESLGTYVYCIIASLTHPPTHPPTYLPNHSFA